MAPWVIALIVVAVVLVVVIALVVWWVKIYNQLVELRERVKNGWAQIDVQLKKRYDLIPNLVETVKGYAKHEHDTLTEVTAARSRATSATTQEDIMAANGELSNALSRLLVSVERYPELKANENFIRLQADLRDIEDKIAFARQFYNDVAQKNNELISKFPSSLVANANKTKFKIAEYFEIENAAVREAPKIQF